MSLAGPIELPFSQCTKRVLLGSPKEAKTGTIHFKQSTKTARQSAVLTKSLEPTGEEDA